MFVPRIDAENLAELEGIAAGAMAAGVKVSRDEGPPGPAVDHLQGRRIGPGETRIAGIRGERLP